MDDASIIKILLDSQVESAARTTRDLVERGTIPAEKLEALIQHDRAYLAGLEEILSGE